jgi:hypothetical protein
MDILAVKKVPLISVRDPEHFCTFLMTANAKR